MRKGWVVSATRGDRRPPSSLSVSRAAITARRSAITSWSRRGDLLHGVGVPVGDARLEGGQAVLQAGVDRAVRVEQPGTHLVEQEPGRAGVAREVAGDVAHEVGGERRRPAVRGQQEPLPEHEGDPLRQDAALVPVGPAVGEGEAQVGPLPGGAVSAGRARKEGADDRLIGDQPQRAHARAVVGGVVEHDVDPDEPPTGGRLGGGPGIEPVECPALEVELDRHRSGLYGGSAGARTRP